MAAQTVPTPLISAIVPIFSEAKNLENLSLWLANHDERDFEVILVIDAPNFRFSPEVEEIKRIAAQKDIQTFEVQFESPGMSRNQGIDACRGKWITFWDCDDLPNLGEIKIMTSKAIEGNYKIALGFFEQQEIQESRIETFGIQYNSKRNFLSSLALAPGVWRFVFDCSLIDNIRFPDFRMGEDQAFLAQVLNNSEKPYIHSESVYRYISGDKNQLTKDKKAILELGQSLGFLIQLRKNGISKEIIIPMYLTQSWSLLHHVDILEKMKIGFRCMRFQGLNFGISYTLLSLHLKQASKRRNLGVEE